jgi:two-component system, sensor histidine kinase and response regulator
MERANTNMLSGVRVLVVDDNCTNRIMLREMLARRGAKVEEAENGVTALERIEHARTNGIPYKLVLLDCQMPDTDGFEVAQRAKAGSAHGLTVVMMSDGFNVQLARARELGLDSCPVKPIRETHLLEEIRTAMARETVQLSVIEPHHIASATIENAAPKMLRDFPQTILLVDDSAINRMLIHAYLENTGCRLDDAANGAIAVAKIKAGNYDLVLMDMQMPVMDGLEATRTIRGWEQKRGLQRTPLLALTASALDDDVCRILQAGADLHVSKPFKKAALIAAIRKIHISALAS